jgi:hypothetical protein
MLKVERSELVAPMVSEVLHWCPDGERLSEVDRVAGRLAPSQKPCHQCSPSEMAPAREV